MVAVLMPHPEPADGFSPRTPVSPRLTTLASRTIGIVNNSWHCMDVVTEELHKTCSSPMATTCRCLYPALELSASTSSSAPTLATLPGPPALALP
jgi:hypothetical protein